MINSLKNKYLTKNNTVKEDLLSKSYDGPEKRQMMLDLVKYYSNWLYSPVDEELENKLYFLEDNVSIEEYFLQEMKNTEDISKKYGVKSRI